MTPYERAVAVLGRQPVVDGHNDLPYALRVLTGGAVSTEDLEKFELDRRQPRTRTDFPRLAEGRVGAQFWSVFVPSHLPAATAVVQTLQQIDLVHAMARLHAGRMVLAGSAAEARAAIREGRIAGLIGAEGGHSIGGSLGVLRMFRELGVRYLTLTHNENVSWADSATDQPRLGGINDFGREVIREMNRIGMIVDLAHAADTTMHAALSVSRTPVMFSHSGARSVCDHPRNVPDDVLVRLSANGGVCMVAFVPGFVSAERLAWQTARADEAARTGRADAGDRLGPPPPVTVAQVADHVEHVREVAGVAHVGVGADFDGSGHAPDGLADVSCYPALFAELAGRGWTDADLAALAGGNALRVLRAADEAST